MNPYHAAAPAIRIDYPRLGYLLPNEIEQARVAGYVTEKSIPHYPGLGDFEGARDQRTLHTLENWRTRLYTIWFSYVWERFRAIPRPLHALEELVIHFDGMRVIGLDLHSLYGSKAGWEPVSGEAREIHIVQLRGVYFNAQNLLLRWR